LDVIGLLRQKGAEVVYHDPYIPTIRHEDWILHAVSDVIASAREADCVVIITNHSVYDYPNLLDNATVIVDTRNALGFAGRMNPKVIRL
jgi:UDP-N-acetyl-D-glucosamine dehydrogenase